MSTSQYKYLKRQCFINIVIPASLHVRFRLSCKEFSSVRSVLNTSAFERKDQMSRFLLSLSPPPPPQPPPLSLYHSDCLHQYPRHVVLKCVCVRVCMPAGDIHNSRPWSGKLLQHVVHWLRQFLWPSSKTLALIQSHRCCPRNLWRAKLSCGVHSHAHTRIRDRCCYTYIQYSRHLHICVRTQMFNVSLSLSFSVSHSLFLA